MAKVESSDSHQFSVESLLAAVVEVPGVRDARVNTSAGGDRSLQLDISEGANEFVVAEQVTRLLDERFALTIDAGHRLAITAQDSTPSMLRQGPERAVRLERVQAIAGGLDSEVQVKLSCAGKKVSGTSSGPASERALLRTTAEATLSALAEVLEEHARLGLDYADIIDVGGDRIVLTLVTFLTPGRTERLCGNALVKGDAAHAAARATLDALNRRLDSFLAVRNSRSTPPSEQPALPAPERFVEAGASAYSREVVVAKGRHSAERSDEPAEASGSSVVPYVARKPSLVPGSIMPPYPEPLPPEWS
ncbi:MAG: hypothetical protein HOQ05_02760 [Corynebacteriales bacterium]|nr:hypothetical protein [Mycobacteriales bacterium]